MSGLQALRVMAALGGFTVISLIAYRVIVNRRFMPKGMRIMYYGSALWVYSYTYLMIDRLSKHAPFDASYWIGNIGTFIVIYGLLYRYQPPQNIGLEVNRVKADKELYDAYRELISTVQDARMAAEEDL